MATFTVRRRGTAKPLTTAQRLDRIIKSARQIMRKDKGLNGDLDRLPMLTWIMFLKFLDDMERIEETRAGLAGRTWRPVVEEPWRWRDWSAPADGITGADLLSFLSAEDTALPDGSRGPGLFAYLRGLRGDDGRRDRRDVVATVFRGFSNRMESGYLLRDVINLVDGIRFDSSEEIHVLGRLYETLLREMRDAAGDSGEFYTPRPMVRFMVEAVAPKLGETVLDPACGTGGFLVESFTHLEQQADTVEKRALLQEGSIVGGEAKSLPFLLAQMNLLLHGVDAPRIDPDNSLRFRLAEIGEAERVDVILTNPPFGGEEERGILSNFPEDRRTAETALLFLQLIMRRLKRGGRGRAAVVVPNGTLFGDGVSARIKADLLQQFNLHTVVRLPEGVFAPYTDIPTNLIFFDTTGPTRTIWYYEQPRPEGRKKYTKTAPLLYEEFADCLKWWYARNENEHAWKVATNGLIHRKVDGRVTACNLDIKNPHAVEKIDHRAPEEIVESTIEKERRIAVTTDEIIAALAGRTVVGWPLVPLGHVISYRKEFITIEPDLIYSRCRVQTAARGIVLRDRVPGSYIKTKKQQVCRAGELLVAEIDAKVGGYGIVPLDLDGAIVSSHYFLFRIDEHRLQKEFFGWYCRTKDFHAQVTARGSTNYAAIRPHDVLEYKIPLPPVEDQLRIVERLGKVAALADQHREITCVVEHELLPSMMQEAFHPERQEDELS